MRYHRISLINKIIYWFKYLRSSLSFWSNSDPSYYWAFLLRVHYDPSGFDHRWSYRYWVRLLRLSCIHKHLRPSWRMTKCRMHFWCAKFAHHNLLVSKEALEGVFCIPHTLLFHYIHFVVEHIHFTDISYDCFCRYNSGGNLESYFFEIYFEFVNLRNYWKFCNFNVNSKFWYRSTHCSSLKKYSMMLKSLQHLMSS